jgi:YggT family protein
MMFAVAVFGLLPPSLGVIVVALVRFYMLLIIAWAILSWFNQGRGVVHDIHEILDRIVSPYVNLFRRFIPTAAGIDFSPLVAILLLQIVMSLLV